jgi:hypothetical protein
MVKEWVDEIAAAIKHYLGNMPSANLRISIADVLSARL